MITLPNLLAWNARITGVLKRSQHRAIAGHNANRKYKIGRYEFDPVVHQLMLDGKPQQLTARESELLQVFFDNMNQTLDRSLVLKKLWGDDTAKNACSMDVFVARLRKYLKADTSIEIINIRGRGYKLFLTI